jgi:hypothetical protein
VTERTELGQAPGAMMIINIWVAKFTGGAADEKDCQSAKVLITLVFPFNEMGVGVPEMVTDELRAMGVTLGLIRGPVNVTVPKLYVVKPQTGVRLGVGVEVGGKLGAGPIGKCWIQAKGATHKTINNELMRSFFICPPNSK